MSTPASTLPAVKAYLVAAITARPEMTAQADSPVLVSYGFPSTYVPSDVIAVLDAIGVISVMAMVGGGGAGWLEESYTLEVTVDCFMGGDQAQAVEERANALAAVVADVVRTDPSLGGLVVQGRPATYRTESGWEDSHKGRRCQVHLGIEVYARI